MFEVEASYPAAGAHEWYGMVLYHRRMVWYGTIPYFRWVFLPRVRFTLQAKGARPPLTKGMLQNLYFFTIKNYTLLI